MVPLIIALYNLELDFQFKIFNSSNSKLGLALEDFGAFVLQLIQVGTTMTYSSKYLEIKVIQSTTAVCLSIYEISIFWSYYLTYYTASAKSKMYKG